MTVKQIIPTHYEMSHGDTKPTTGIPPITTIREIDTNMMWITYDGGTNWIVADKRVRLVGEDGSFLALDEQLDDLLANIAAIEHYAHSRTRVYPQDVRLVADLVAAAANVFGDWIEIIPIDTVDFDYEVMGLIIEETDAATTYLIQLGFSLVDGTEPTEAQIAGERRTLLPTPAVRATELLEIKSQNIPADAKLWGRIKSKAGGSETLGVSVAIARHIEITNPVTKLATWPWST